jgi:hypothetical protein
MPKTTVYYFIGYDIATDQMIRSKRMATRERIKRFNCSPLNEPFRHSALSLTRLSSSSGIILTSTRTELFGR